MRSLMNNVNVISKGIIVSLVVHMLMVVFLVVSQFQISSVAFTILLLVAMSVSGFYIGGVSKHLAEVNGMIVGLFTSIILLLFIAQYTSMDWVLNSMLCASYVVVSFISSLVARIIARNKSLEERVFTKEKTEHTPLLKKKSDNMSKKKKTQLERRVNLSKLKKRNGRETDF